MSFFEERAVKTTLLQRQALAVPMLGCGVAKNEVARRLDVTPSTLSGWLRDEGFSLAVAHEQRRVVEDVQKQIRALGESAVQAIRDGLDPTVVSSAAIS